MKNKTWIDYYEATKDNPPTKILVSSVDLLEDTAGKALELGAGSPKDSIYLLEKGFEVTAVDKAPGSKKLFSGLESNKNFKFISSSFSEFEFEKDKYTLISAQRSLPFINSEEELKKVFGNIKNSLKTGGVFVGHLFGTNDTWCKKGRSMTFVTKEEVETLLEGMEIKELIELEEDSPTANGDPHHWHMFDIIAVKI